jgi:hypothetical protein
MIAMVESRTERGGKIERQRRYYVVGQAPNLT